MKAKYISRSRRVRSRDLCAIGIVRKRRANGFKVRIGRTIPWMELVSRM